jgi:hypothetical protein
MEQKKVFQQAWLESLAALFGLIISVDVELSGKREQLQLDGERLFDNIVRGQYQRDIITHASLSNWIYDNCGYALLNEDVAPLIDSLDRNGNGVVSRAEFVRTVSAYPEEEEEAGPEEEEEQNTESKEAEVKA